MQQRLQFAHVLKGELKRFEATDGRLREDVAVERAQGQTDVGLRVAQLDSSLLEHLGELLEVVRARRLLFAMSMMSVAN